jgi:hypothetical protein
MAAEDDDQAAAAASNAVQIGNIALAFETLAKYKYCSSHADKLQECALSHGRTQCAAERRAWEDCVRLSGRVIIGDIGRYADAHCVPQMAAFEACSARHGADACLTQSKAAMECGAQAVLSKLRTHDD